MEAGGLTTNLWNYLTTQLGLSEEVALKLVAQIGETGKDTNSLIELAKGYEGFVSPETDNAIFVRHFGNGAYSFVEITPSSGMEDINVTKITYLRDSAGNPTLLAGQYGIDTNTGRVEKRRCVEKLERAVRSSSVLYGFFTRK